MNDSFAYRLISPPQISTTLLLIALVASYLVQAALQKLTYSTPTRPRPRTQTTAIAPTFCDHSHATASTMIIVSVLILAVEFTFIS